MSCANRAPSFPPGQPRTDARPAAVPRVLFASPDGAAGVDSTYLSELGTRGFTTDYTESLDELTEERIFEFDAVVVFTSPDAYDKATNRPPRDRDQAFARLVDRYVRSGGGVLLLPQEMNTRKQRVRVLTDLWGAQIPAERIIEQDRSKIARMPRGSYRVQLTFTDQIAPSPVTRGVSGLWYPQAQGTQTDITLPLVVDDTWKVVARASATASTSPFDLRDSFLVAPNLLQRAEPQRAPPLVAIRQIAAGRAALVAMWPQFSVMSGTKWLFDRVVLSRGVGNRPSDFGRLLENTLRWLTEPSVARGAARRPVQAGKSSPPTRIEALRRVMPDLPAKVIAEPRSTLVAADRVMRGLIGAQSSHSGGRSSVAEYARAARSADLQFVVFLDEMAELTPQKLAALTEDCARSSGPDLLLLPGFKATTNLGNRMFFFGPRPSWPPPNVLTPDAPNILYVQLRDNAGRFTGYGSEAFSGWIHDDYYSPSNQVGYFAFRRAPEGVSLRDARLYSMAGVRYFRDGKLVEDVTDEYLRAVHGISAPIPATVHEVSSAASLMEQAQSARGLTFIVASKIDSTSRDGVYARGLRWESPPDAMSTFSSSGPMLRSWATADGAFASYTYGAEGFVPSRSVMTTPLVVTAQHGLREVSLYDGQTLLRRIALHGATEYAHTFVLAGNISHNLVVIARDRKGASAISAPKRSWTDGGAAPVFCADHINDCRHMLLARGPWSLRLSDAPILPESVAGVTWDGGPFAESSALGAQSVAAQIHTRSERVSADRMLPVGVLDFADEGATGVTAIRTAKYHDALLQVLNPWHTYGPIQQQTPSAKITESYRMWLMASRGIPERGWPATAVGRDRTATLYTSTIRLTRRTTIESAKFAHFQRRTGVSLAVLDPNGSVLSELSLDQPGVHDLALPPGHGLAVHESGDANSHLLVNGGGPLQVHVSDAVEFIDAVPPSAHRVQQLQFVMGGYGYALTEGPRGLEPLQATMRSLLPGSLEVLRGKREATLAIAEIASAGGAAEVRAVKDPAVRLIPLRISGLNPRWSAGLLQKSGFSLGNYGPSSGRYRAVAVDQTGRAHVPLDVADAENHILVGHPIVADANGQKLFIEAICLGGNPPRWHVSINNPTRRRISTALRSALDLPGLDFKNRVVTIEPGALIDLDQP